MSETQATDTYNSIASPTQGSYKELGSKFLSFAHPVSSEEEVKTILNNLKKEYFDARHHCYAYRLGLEGDLWRANDDGEPSSSAGKPILGQLLSHQLSDILIVVVRYFGGTKLGVPGLIRAYRSAAADAISNGEIIEKISSKIIIISFDYVNMEPVMKIIKNLNPELLNQEFGLRCNFKLRVRDTQYDNLTNALSQTDGVQIT